MPRAGSRPGRAGCGWDCHLPFPLPSPDQVAHARQLINDDIKPAEVARLLKVHRATSALAVQLRVQEHLWQLADC
ncbi:hypothetical protein MesoLjLa_67210 (plasmid) [Mesorhizobium sp. L-2-11]|nr:hypothetical protein MesoLjLa_67210 [Mesorhizobium sp. L-2-11]